MPSTMSMRFSPGTWRLPTLCAAFTLLVASARPCHAQPAPREDQEQARRSYDHALSLFDHGQNRPALAELERAYQLFPSFRIFYNIGIVNTTLDDPAAALRAFERYLTEGGSHIEAERRKDVEHRMAALSRRAGSLRVTVDEPGALILVDDTEVGKSPLDRAHWLNPGRHRLEVRAADGRAQDKSFDVTGGSDTEQGFTFKALEPASAPPASTAPVDVAPGPRLPWAAYGISAALGAATIVTGVLALGARSDERATERRLTTAQELQDAQHKVDHLALASDIFLAATAVSAGVSVYLTLQAKRDSSPRTALVIGPGSIAAFTWF